MLLLLVCCPLQDAATLQWRSPADNGAVVSCYQLEVDDGRQGEFRLAYTGTDTQCVVQKLQSGLNYRFRLRAENSVSSRIFAGVESWALASFACACCTVCYNSAVKHTCTLAQHACQQNNLSKPCFFYCCLHVLT
jgi:hypothetical protein